MGSNASLVKALTNRKRRLKPKGNTIMVLVSLKSLPNQISLMEEANLQVLIGFRGDLQLFCHVSEYDELT